MMENSTPSISNGPSDPQRSVTDGPFLWQWGHSRISLPVSGSSPMIETSPCWEIASIRQERVQNSSSPVDLERTALPTISHRHQSQRPLGSLEMFFWLRQRYIWFSLNSSSSPWQSLIFEHGLHIFSCRRSVMSHLSNPVMVKSPT